MMNTDWGHGSAVPQGLTFDFPRAVGLTDPAVAVEHLRRGLAGRRPVTRCSLLKLRHLPGRLLQAIYRVAAPGCDDDIVTVSFLREGEAVAAAGDGPAIALPDWNALLRIFPDDPALVQLPALLDAPSVSARLAQASGAALAPGDMSWSLLSYQPGDRCALRYRWSTAGIDAVGKLQVDAAASHAGLRRLWELPGRRFRMPQPLSCDEALSTRWECFLAGRPFEQVAAESGIVPALEAVTRGLVDLHRSAMRGMPVQDRARLLGRIQRKVLPRVRGALPDMAGECEAFAAVLGRIATSLPPAMAVTVHGDLHTGNILLDDSGLVLIDLDSLASGEPAFDLAMIGTRLLLLALLGDAGFRETAGAVADLPRYYADAGGDQVAPGVFAWYVAALLVGRQIKTSINNLAPGLDDLARRLLDRASAVLAAGRVDAGLLVGT